MFSKSLSKIDEQDIQFLVENEQKESVILEYKETISGNDRDKKELPKDISAIANTDGGFVIFGIREANGVASEIVGIDKLIGKQSVEEWVENVLISNIRPRVAVKPRIIPISSDEDKVVLVLQVPKSPRRPHMVTAGGRNAYYKRHNYQATYADEHEVRSMVLESKTSIDEMKDFLDGRNLSDRRKDNFAITPLSEEIAKEISKTRKIPDDFEGKPFVLLASCPRYLEERVDIASSEFHEWLSQKDQIELFDFNIDFLDSNTKITADSIRSIKEKIFGEENQRMASRYVEIFRNGYVENGFGSELMYHVSIDIYKDNDKIDRRLFFHIAFFTAAFWLFMKFIRDFYSKIGYADEVSIVIALADIKGVTIHGFGNRNEREKWPQPYYDSRYRYRSDKLPTAQNKNFKYEKNLIVSELSDEEIEKIVKEVALRVSNNFGETIAKCFDDNGNFGKNLLREFRNVGYY